MGKYDPLRDFLVARDGGLTECVQVIRHKMIMDTLASSPWQRHPLESTS